MRNALGRLLAGVLVLLAADTVRADILSIGGRVTQSTDDGTGPAMNNPSLNNIHDGDAYAVTLAFMGSITAPGMYSLAGASLVFKDAAAAATENSFGAIHLTVSANGVFDDISLLGCLTTGSDCSSGNELTANFRVLAAQLNLQNVTPTELDQPHPLDLLEDDGVTDIHGSLTSYTYTSASPIPEPSSLLLFSFGVTALIFGGYRQRRRPKRIAVERWGLVRVLQTYQNSM